MVLGYSLAFENKNAVSVCAGQSSHGMILNEHNPMLFRVVMRLFYHPEG
jgi:hypothetical protein